MKARNGKVYAPWEPEVVMELNTYQAVERFHPFTCERHSDTKLFATREGWECPECGYRQSWAHEWIANGAWREGVS